MKNIEIPDELYDFMKEFTEDVNALATEFIEDCTEDLIKNCYDDEVKEKWREYSLKRIKPAMDNLFKLI